MKFFLWFRGEAPTGFWESVQEKGTRDGSFCVVQ